MSTVAGIFRLRFLIDLLVASRTRHTAGSFLSSQSPAQACATLAGSTAVACRLPLFAIA
jgi:hypothetical protein